VIYLGRPCKVCLSPYRAEIEELRLKKKLKYIEIKQILRHKYGWDISISALSRHFTRHVEDYYKASLEADKFRLRYVKEQINAIVRAAKSIREQMEILQQQLSQVLERAEDPEARREAREIMRSIRELVELMFRFEDKFKTDNRTTSEIYDKIMLCLRDFPPDLVNKFIQRWEEVFSEG